MARRRKVCLAIGSSSCLTFIVAIRCGSIQAVEEIKKEVMRLLKANSHSLPTPSTPLTASMRLITMADAVTLDFALWNLAKAQEFTADLLPHHRTRSVFY
jgi:hypothetical protein